MKHLPLKFVVWIEFGVLLLFPARAGTILDGIPLNQPVEYALFIILLINLFLYVLNSYGVSGDENGLKRMLPRNLIRGLNEWHGGVFFIALLVRLLLFTSNTFVPLTDIAYCYESASQQAVSTPCFLNTDHLFRWGPYSYMNSRLRWDGRGGYENWNANDRQYRPARVHVSGFISLPASHELKLLHSGKIAGTIGSMSLSENTTSRNEKILSFPEGPSLLPIQIDFPATPDSYFEIQNQIHGLWLTSRAAAPGDFVFWRRLVEIALMMEWITLMGLGILFLMQSALYVYINGYLLLPFLFVPILLNTPTGYSLPGIAGVVFALSLHEKKKWNQVRYLNWLLILGGSIGVYFLVRCPLYTPLLRPPGDDPYTIESFARIILKTHSLEGGESTFFYQPGFRYYMALLLALFGEYNCFPAMLNLTLYFVSIWLLFVWLDNRIHPTLYSRCSSLISIIVLIKAGMGNVTLNLSEFLSWILLIGSLMALFTGAQWYSLTDFQFDSKRLPAWAVPLYSAGLAFAAINRPNQVVGLTVLYLVGLFLIANSKKDLKGGLWSLKGSFILYGTILLFPLWHNLHYGHNFILFSLGTNNTSAFVLYPRQLLDLGLSTGARQLFFSQLSAILVIQQFNLHILTKLAFNAVLLIFILSSLKAYKERAKHLVAAAYLIVACFVAVHVFYQVTNYYPRHIIVFYLMMSIFSVIMLSGTSRSGLFLFAGLDKPARNS